MLGRGPRRRRRTSVPEQAAEDREAPAASATALAEDLGSGGGRVPAAQDEAADGVTAAQAAEDQAPVAEDSPNKAAEPVAVAAPAEAPSNDDDAAPRIEDMDIDEEAQQPKKDRNAAYKAMLEADARRASRNRPRHRGRGRGATRRDRPRWASATSVRGFQAEAGPGGAGGRQDHGGRPRGGRRRIE